MDARQDEAQDEEEDEDVAVEDRLARFGVLAHALEDKSRNWELVHHQADGALRGLFHLGLEFQGELSHVDGQQENEEAVVGEREKEKDVRT